MTSIDQQFVEYIVKSLVGNPDAVSIERRIDEKGVLLELTVDPDDLGRVIGKRGATAQSLRTLLRALGTKNDARYNLKIIDNGAPMPDGGRRGPAEQSSGTGESSGAEDGWSRPAPGPGPVNQDSNNDSTSSSDEPDDVSEPAESTTEDEESDVVRKTRAELSDLDDL